MEKSETNGEPQPSPSAVPPPIAPAPPKSRRGFASMTPDQRRALGSRGGRTAHERGTANRFTPETASAAGRVPHERGTAHKWTSEQAREAGRKGGMASRRTRSSQIVTDDRRAEEK